MFPKFYSAHVRRALLVVLSLLTCFILAGTAKSAIAHNADQSYLYFQVTDDALSARAEIPVKDINQVLNLGLPSDREISNAEIKPHLEKIRAYVDQHMEIRCAPQECRTSFTTSDLLDAEAQFLQLNYQITGFQQRPEVVEAKYDVILADKAAQKSSYTNMLLIEQNWSAGTFGNEANPFTRFTEPGRTHRVEFAAGNFWQGFSMIVKLGIDHMIYGIDHVLFVVALLLPSVLRRKENRWQPVESLPKALLYTVKVATAFTIAHSLTLVLATLQIIQLPDQFIESVIAASIGLAIIEIFYPIFKDKFWIVVFIFGLFHGLGFAAVMRPLGITSQHASLSLFGFNLGVELGQLAIIALIFPVLYLLRKQRFYTPLIAKVGGLALVGTSIYWFIERAFEVNLPLGAFIRGFIPG